LGGGGGGGSAIFNTLCGMRGFTIHNSYFQKSSTTIAWVDWIKYWNKFEWCTTLDNSKTIENFKITSYL